MKSLAPSPKATTKPIQLERVIALNKNDGARTKSGRRFLCLCFLLLSIFTSYVTRHFKFSSFSFSDANIAAVTPEKVRGANVGTATAFAQGDVQVYGGPCGCYYEILTPSDPVTVTPSVSFSPISSIAIGQTATTTATVLPTNNSTPITLSISAPATVVSPTGTFTTNTSVVVKGLTVGTATLTATVPNPDGGSPLRVGSASIAVIAIPVNLHQTNVIDAGNGDLRFTYVWSSSSGNTADLTACTVGEIVTYPGIANPFPYPSPPFPPNAPPNPTIKDLAATTGTFQDDHLLAPTTTFVRPYSVSSFTATQYYRFRSTNYNSGNYVNLVGPLSIVRSVGQNSNGTWKFTVTKSGASATINPLP